MLCIKEGLTNNKDGTLTLPARMKVGDIIPILVEGIKKVHLIKFNHIGQTVGK